MDGKEQHEEEVDAKLVHETLELLSNVTYIRIIVDKINFVTAPEFVRLEARRTSSPRDKGQIYLVYQIPSISKLTPRGSGKTVKVVAKEITDDIVIFADKHVSLCRLTPYIIDDWASNSCDIKFYYRPPGKRTSICFAKCSIPMAKILVLPFSFDSSKVPLDMSLDFHRCMGYLKICIQLGSRMQHFGERVEPLRNPSASAAFSSMSSSSIKSPRIRHVRCSEFGNNNNRNVTQGSSRFFVENHAISSARDKGPSWSGFHANSAKTYTEMDHWTTSVAIARSPVLEPSRNNESHQNSIAHHSPSKNIVDHDVLVSPEKIKEIKKPQYKSCIKKPFKEPSQICPLNTHLVDGSSLASSTSPICHNIPDEADILSRKHTVAERLKSKFSPIVEESQREKSVPTIKFPEFVNGYWLQITVAKARHLPRIKSHRDGFSDKANCFVTYGNNDRISRSDIVPKTTQPVWNWTTQLFVPPDRKNIVFKVWHRPDDVKARSRVLGFVLTDLNPKLSETTSANWFDIIDLARNSFGQLQIIFGPPSPLIDVTNSNVNDCVGFGQSEQFWDGLDSSSAEKSPNDSPVYEIDVQHKINDDLINLDEPNKFEKPRIKEDVRRRDSMQPFVEMTTRSFLADKLKQDMGELTDSLQKLSNVSTTTGGGHFR